ncbi:MAG TPA: PQQ-dependent sugar dehydrogenase, partial [Verrucomicrobiae bacterium]|nr:PQQ-dependent sugar dehydrogenase [Verrucomicrobiae bacterium]
MNITRRLSVAVAFLAASSTQMCLAQDKGWPRISMEKFASGFKQPTFIGNAGDGSGRIFVVERQGIIRIIKNGKVLPRPFLDITGRPETRGAEQGLLSFAFPRDKAKKNHFYVDYTSKKGLAGDSNISRFQLLDPDQADSRSEEVLLTIHQPYINHNGGQLAFGPDGYLYIGKGDGGSAGDPQRRAQNKKELLGKLLRIDVEGDKKPYAIPPDNPFGNEIWAWGLRNPWRFSFDR